MSKKKKEPKFGIESVMRLAVFLVLIYLAIGYLSHTSSSFKVPSLDSKVLGAFSPQVEQGQKWLQIEIDKLKSQALDKLFDNIKNSIIKK